MNGVKSVMNDQMRTEKVSIFLPPNFLEKLPPIICFYSPKQLILFTKEFVANKILSNLPTWLLKYPMGKADKIQPWSCMFQLNSRAIGNIAMGMMALSAAFIRFEIEHRAIVLDALVTIVVILFKLSNIFERLVDYSNSMTGINLLRSIQLSIDLIWRNSLMPFKHVKLFFLYIL